MRNEVVLDGIVLRIGETRYSPAGVPRVHFVVRHEGTHEEAGLPRRVRFQALVVAIGEALVGMIGRLVPDQPVRIRGFLDRQGYRSEATRLVVHARSIERLDRQDATNIERG